MKIAEEFGRSRDDFARPFVPAVEFEGANAHERVTQAPFVFGELVIYLPLVGGPAGDERRRHPLQSIGRELGRNVAAN
jgi:hypothetical protein